jgi:hypothetical protein
VRAAISSEHPQDGVVAVTLPSKQKVARDLSSRVPCSLVGGAFFWGEASSQSRVPLG